MDDLDIDLDFDVDDFPEILSLDGDSNHALEPEDSCEAVNGLLSKDLMRMSAEDRVLVAEEVHGVRNLAVEENGDDLTTEKISKSLLELDQILEYRIPVNEKTAFLRAQSFEETSGTYVNDVGFRMKFLRCKLFNVEEAARLLINYLEVVQELYGDVCLRRPIRLDDVQSTKEERKAFRYGYIQLLPFGDRAGRRIIVITTDALDYNTRIRVKIFLYIWTVASNDIATQQKGAILILWDGRKDMTLPRPSEQQLAIFAFTVGAAEHRNRLRFHVGEDSELKYQVGTFGVPVSQIPVTETGNVKRGSFQNWIRMRMVAEEMAENEATARRQRRKQVQAQQNVQTQRFPWHISTLPNPHNIPESNEISPSKLFVEYPGLNDVAFRKGVSLMHHPGNDFFHGLIQSKVYDHENESQTGKSRITWWVVDEIRKRNGRFLSWDQRGWWNVFEDESKIRLRVAVSFREWKKHLKAIKTVKR